MRNTILFAPDPVKLDELPFTELHSALAKKTSPISELVGLLEKKPPIGVTQPRLLSESDQVADFSCGNKDFDAWLKQEALNCQTTFTFIIANHGSHRVIGYYAFYYLFLCKENEEDNTIPVSALSLLVVDESEREHGIGSYLLSSALKMLISKEYSHIPEAVITIPVKGKSDFYRQYGFKPVAEGNEDMLFLPWQAILASNDVASHGQNGQQSVKG